ncbi:MAG TPA: FKBP-type peptidyl-prolyl cis-trans isomerase [Patescibacteria group bacterium]|nr:FKBP-type peptidyl-prolyl cis-trans isomerase [Patescibacteria group bacterium]
MRKDFINALLVFFIVVFAGVGLMYFSNNLASLAPTPTPTPPQTQQAQNQPSDADLRKLIKIQDEVVGTGQAVKSGDTITVNYTGTLTNGKVFDTSIGKQPFTTQIGVGQVIKGWDLGIIGMKVGGKRKLTIPSVLGYGAQTQGAIPANSTLIFEVELLGIK